MPILIGRKMRCPYCKAEVLGHEEVCPSCGAPIELEKEKPQPQAPGKTLSIIAIILAIAGALLGWIYGAGLLLSVAAIITGIIARKREPDAKNLAGAAVWISVGVIVVMGTLVVLYLTVF